MSLRSRAARDKYRAGDAQIFIAPCEEWASPGTFPSALHSVGYSGNAIHAIAHSAGGGGTLVRTVAERTALLSIDAGGVATFGNDTAIAAVEQAATWMEAQGRPGPFLLVGTSMGFSDLLAWARTRPDDVMGAISVMGLPDLTWLWQQNADLGDGTASTAKINEAYGGAYDPVAHGPTHNPIEYAAGLPFPIAMFYADDDPLIPFSRAVAFAGVVPQATLYNTGPGGHTNVTQGKAAQHPALKQFISSL